MKMVSNSVLKSSSEVDVAVNYLRSLGLFPHPDRVKSWDVSKMINIINEGARNSFVLDVGCNGSPLLPMLRRLGFKNLYGCDLSLPKYPPRLMKVVCSFYKRDYRPIIEMYENKAYNISIQDLEKTKFQSKMFDYISSLSVIEHNINLQNYFKEMNRILRENGILLTSTDYWPDKIVNEKSDKFSNPKKLHSDNIFSKNEIEEDVVKVAEQNGFTLTKPIDFAYKDKVIHWNVSGLDFTFIFFALKKNNSL